MQLRPYQTETKSNVYAIWDNKQDANVLIVKPTGSGKTVTLASIIHDNDGPVCAIAHRQELVGQIAMALAREGIKHRLIAPTNVIKEIVREQTRELGRTWYDPQAPVAVAGVDTLIRRGNDPKLKAWMNSVTLWVQDEAHHVLQKNKWGKAAELFPNALGLGVTATPERADGAGLGRHADGLFDCMVEGPSMRWLIENGYLTDYRIFAPEQHLVMDAEDIGSTGDFKQQAVTVKFRKQKNKIIGDVVGHYCKHAHGKLGVVFVPDVEDAHETADAFCAAGIPAEAVSAKTPDRERNAILRRFKARELLILVNVDLFGEGFDLPAIEVVSMARPTASYALYCQQFGRALRLMDGKEYALIIDHVGNVQRHGLPDRPRVWSLNRRERSRRGEADPDMIPTKTCQECTAVYEAIHDVCPFCGHYNEPAGRSSPEQVDGNLIELDAVTLAAMRGEVARIDESPASLRSRMQSGGAPSVAVAGAVKNHRLRQAAQAALRECIALWAGYQRQMGRSDSESYKRFYWRYGVDVLSAQALGRREAENLTEKIGNELLTFMTERS